MRFIVPHRRNEVVLDAPRDDLFGFHNAIEMLHPKNAIAWRHIRPDARGVWLPHATIEITRDP